MLSFTQIKALKYRAIMNTVAACCNGLYENDSSKGQLLFPDETLTCCKKKEYFATQQPKRRVLAIHPASAQGGVFAVWVSPSSPWFHSESGLEWWSRWPVQVEVMWFPCIDLWVTFILFSVVNELCDWCWWFWHDAFFKDYSIDEENQSKLRTVSWIVSFIDHSQV